MEGELTLQSKCFQWHWNTFPTERQMLFHVQQKAKNAIEGSMFKAIGVVRGISDLVYILPNGKVAFIEMKFNKGTQRAEQITFQKKLKERGHIYLIVEDTLEAFKEIILKLRNEK